MLNWLKSIFGAPKPSGPPETIRRFRPTDATLTQGSIVASQDGWLINLAEGQTIRLFEVADPQAENCLITYRAMIKTDGLDGRTFLEMWCRLPGFGEFFSKGIDQAIKGTTNWSSQEIPFYLKKGQRPDLIKLNIVIEGKGKVWIKDIELLKTPLSS